VRDRLLAAARRWNAGRDTAGDEGVAEAGTVVTTVGDKFACPDWELRQHDRGAAMVTGLALSEQEHDGPPLSVAGGMELGVQAALGAADAAGKSPF